MTTTFLKRLAGGDSRATVSFYKLYSPKILPYLSKRLPANEDAQELTNDVFLEAIDSISLLRNQNNILAWLYKIAHNKTVDYYRKRKIKSIILSQIPYLEIVAAEINQPEFQFEKNKVRDKIEFAFRSLPEIYRKILKFHYEEKIPVKELAVIFNLSFKATESLLFRARQSFKLAYERE